MSKGQPMPYELPACESCAALREQLATARQMVWEEAAKRAEEKADACHSAGAGYNHGYRGGLRGFASECRAKVKEAPP